MSKRIYLCITPFFPTEKSFRGPFIYDQVNAIIRNSDFDVIVYKVVSLSEYNCSEKEYIYGGIKVFLFPEQRLPSYFFNGCLNKHNASHFKTKLLNDGVDIARIKFVHCHTSDCGIYGLKVKELNPNVKVLLQHHDRDPFCIVHGKLAGWKPNTRFRAKKNLEIFNKIDLHICVSQSVRDNLLSFPLPGKNEMYQPYLKRLKNVSSLQIEEPYRSIVLYNGVDLQKFHSESKSVKNTEVFTIGCIGNFVNWKRQSDLINAIYILRNKYNIDNLNVKFVGSGPTLDKCRQLSLTLHLEDICTFVTETDHSNLMAFYNNIDLFVLPSVFEGFGCVFTEAAACNVPYMIPFYQGATEYLTEEEREVWAFPPGDYHQLAYNIKNYYNHSTRKQHYSYTLDINKLVKSFLDHIDSLWP